MPRDQLDDTLSALSDRTRRAILARLSSGDTRVTDLAAPFAISLNSVSKHIRILERADLVRREVRGREHVLSLNTEPLDRVASWIATQQKTWGRRLAAMDEALQRRRQEAGKGRRR